MVKNVWWHDEEQWEKEIMHKTIKELKFDEKLKIQKAKRATETQSTKVVNKVKYRDYEMEERLKKFIEEKKREEAEEKFNKSLMNWSISSKRRIKRRR